MPNKKKATIFDVAKLAKVSITTVSRVINKVPTVKENNRIRVENAIQELGFVPDVSAQRLAGAQNLSIGFVLPFYEDMFYTFYAMEILRGVSIASAESNLDLLINFPQKQGDVLDAQIIDSSRVSGILFAEYYNNRPLIEKAANLGIPFVVANYYSNDFESSCIGVDNFQAGIDATEYLVKLGHKKIAIITGKMEAQPAQQRLKGFKQVLDKHSIGLPDDYIVEGDWKGASGYKAMRKILSLRDNPTAVFVCGDEMAIEAINAALEAGLKIPEDISIIGFDDVPQASTHKIPLTTMKQPLAEIGKIGVEILNKTIKENEEEVLRKLLKAELVERSSCSSLK